MLVQRLLQIIFVVHLAHVYYFYQYFFATLLKVDILTFPPHLDAMPAKVLVNGSVVRAIASQQGGLGSIPKPSMSYVN